MSELHFDHDVNFRMLHVTQMSKQRSCSCYVNSWQHLIALASPCVGAGLIECAEIRTITAAAAAVGASEMLPLFLLKCLITFDRLWFT